jgi:hypothetical protein
LSGQPCFGATDPSEKDASPRIELRPADKSHPQAFVVAGLSPSQLDALRRTERDANLAGSIDVFAGLSADEARQPMLGETRLEENTLVFEPRFPLEPGVSYHAVFRAPAMNEGGAPTTVAKVFTLDRLAETPATVAQVFPTASVLPENQLKFYLHFSRPMSRGEAYRHIALLGEDGKPVDHPFLELGEELWDATGTRFTLFFDPGRIKRGLKPREEVGPSLEEGKSYTLVIDASWPDANGQPLAESYRKAFRVAAPDDAQPSVRNWRISPPRAATRDPLDLRFPEPLDHAMLQRVLQVVDPFGAPVTGVIQVSNRETRWRFIPQVPWSGGSYHLVIDSALEDLAGNSLRRPFEVDVTRPVEVQERIETITLPFLVGR